MLAPAVVVLPSTDQRPFFEAEISGLRGLAVLMVIFGHLVQRVERFSAEGSLDEFGPGRLLIASFSSPAAGVYLFFVISGYLIASRLAVRSATTPSGLASFFLRRAVRIAPAYSIVLLATYLVIVATGFEPDRVFQFDVRPNSLTASLFASLAYLHELLYGTFPRLFPPGWTIEVEIQFYILAPILCPAVRSGVARMGLGRTAGIALAGSGSLALVVLRSNIANLQDTLLVYLPLFMLGIVLDEVRRSGWRPTSTTVTALGWPATIVFVVFEPWVSGQGVEIAIRLLLIALIFGSLASGRGSLLRVCRSPAAVTLGLASYSLYLVHLQVLHLTATVMSRVAGPMPFLQTFLLDAVVGLPLVMGAAWTFYVLVERFFLRWSRGPWTIRAVWAGLPRQ